MNVRGKPNTDPQTDGQIFSSQARYLILNRGILFLTFNKAKMQ